MSAYGRTIRCADRAGGWEATFQVTSDRGVVSFTRAHPEAGSFPYQLTSKCGLFAVNGP
jgi:hypothetical protein